MEVEQVREGAVPARLAATYVDIRHALQSPEVPLAFRALAATPGALAEAWGLLGPFVRTRAFEREVGGLHAAAVRAAVDLGTPLLEQELRCAGLDVDAVDGWRALLRERECVEERSWLCMAGLARWLAGESRGAGTVHSEQASAQPRAAELRVDAPVRPPPAAAAVATTLCERLRLLALPSAFQPIADSEPALAVVRDELIPLLSCQAAGHRETALRQEARRAWDRLPETGRSFEPGAYDPALIRLWRERTEFLEQELVREGLLLAALRVGLDGAEDALVTSSSD
jgi:hypothetical protein